MYIYEYDTIGDGSHHANEINGQKRTNMLWTSFIHATLLRFLSRPKIISVYIYYTKHNKQATE
jgi:hypothetical protein